MADLDVVPNLHLSLEDDSFWGRKLCAHISGETRVSIHIAVFSEPFLGLVLDGSKRFESRFSTNHIDPYLTAEDDDILLLKRVGGPIVGIAEIGRVNYFRMPPFSLNQIRNEYESRLCVDDPEFWKYKSDAEYASIMEVKNVRKLPSIEFRKRDRRGWVVLSRRRVQMTLW